MGMSLTPSRWRAAMWLRRSSPAAASLCSCARAGGASSRMRARSLVATPMGSGGPRGGGARGLFDEREPQRHDVLRVEAPRLHERPRAVHEAEALADVGERQTVAVALSRTRIERVAHHDGHEPAAD